MTWAEFVRHFAARYRIPKMRAQRILKGVFAEVASEVHQGKSVRVPSFGTFYRKERAPTTAIAPPGTQREGEVLRVGRRYSIGLRPSDAQKRGGPR